MNKFDSQFPIFLLLQRGWHYAGNHRPAMVLYIVFFILAQLSTQLEPYLIGRILNAVQSGSEHATKSSAAMWNEISYCLWFWFWTQLAFWAFHGPGRIIERYVAFHIGAEYKLHLLNMVMSLPLKWHRQHHSGESIDKINNAAASLNRFFDDSFDISYMVFRLIGSIVALFWFMPFAGWLALGTTAIACLNVFLFDRYLSGQYKHLNAKSNVVASAVHDYLTNIVSVITLRLEKRVAGEVNRRIYASLPLYTRTISIHEGKWFFVTMAIAVMTAVVLGQYAHGQLSGGQILLTGTFFTLFEYLRRIGESFYNFAGLYGTVVRQAADVQSADSIVDASSTGSTPGVYALPEQWKQLVVSQLQFRYEDEQHREHHLADIAVELRPGRSIALVGESGSGKSTFLSLLRGLQDADRVCVSRATDSCCRMACDI